MAESLSVPLGEQEHLKEFFEVMRDNGKKMQAEDMERLFDYITVLQRDLKEAIEEVGVHAVDSQNELFKTCDIVSLHIPATPETKQSINYELINQMKKGGIVINTARKEVIDEAGLMKLMTERDDIKYITDIKPDADEEFAKLEGRYFSTPKKMGAQTAEANINAGIAAAKQINAYFKDGCTKYQVNK